MDINQVSIEYRKLWPRKMNMFTDFTSEYVDNEVHGKRSSYILRLQSWVVEGTLVKWTYASRSCELSFIDDGSFASVSIRCSNVVDVRWVACSSRLLEGLFCENPFYWFTWLDKYQNPLVELNVELVCQMSISSTFSFIYTLCFDSFNYAYHLLSKLFINTCFIPWLISFFWWEMYVV